MLILHRILPHWLGRLLATLVAVAALGALWSLRGLDTPRLQLFWEPLGVFRTSPSLYVDSLSLFAGLTLTSVVGALVLGIRTEEEDSGLWKSGLLLVALAGGLIMAMAANLPTLAMGSALVDLALIGSLLPTGHDGARSLGPVWVAIVTGVMSTLLLFASALHMSAQLGTTSLLAPDQSSQVLVMLAVAGLLRVMVFPLHPRKLASPQEGGLVVLAVGIGLMLLARTQALEPILSSQPWIQTLGSIAILAGALLVWAARRQPAELSQADSTDPDSGASNTPSAAGRGPHRLWTSILVHQTGFALAFFFQLGDTVPWPLLSVTVALSIMTVWWDASGKQQPGVRPIGSEWAARQAEALGSRVRSYLAERIPLTARWNSVRVRTAVKRLLPSIALVSLVGAPLTAGALTRWPLYAAVLARDEAGLLLILLVADTFLAAGLWLAWAAAWKQAESPLSISSTLAMLGLVLLLLITGIAPDRLPASLGLEPRPTADVSVWGLGLLYIIPWLVGAWLARVRRPTEEVLGHLWAIVNLEWLYRATAWAGRQVRMGIHWIGVVGEGDGWWGWALVVLAVGAVLLAVR